MARATILHALILCAAVAPFLVGCRNPARSVTPTTAPPPMPRESVAPPPAPAKAPAAEPASTGIAWVRGYEAGLKQAQERKAPAILDFCATWCGPCQRMEKESWPAPEVVKAAQGFVCIKVDIDEDHAAAAKYNIDAVPTMVFLKPDGTELDRHVGFADASELAELISKAGGR